MTSRWFTNSVVRKDQLAYGKKLKSDQMAKLKRAYLDVNFPNLPKVRALSRVFGKISPWALVQIYLSMSNATDARIDEDALLCIVEDTGIADPSNFITYCLEKGLIELFREIIPDSPGKNPTIPGNESGLPDTDYDNDSDTESKLESSHPELTAATNGSKQVLEFVWLDEIQIDTWRGKLGDQGFDRACEKLNGWIGQSKGTHEFPDRVAKGRNAAFTFQNWVARAVANEHQSRAGPKKSQAELNQDASFEAMFSVLDEARANEN